MQGRNTNDLEQALASCTQLHSFLDENEASMPEQSVSELLALRMEEKGLSRTDVIAGSGLNDIYAHQIFSGKRTPSRNKLLCLCFGLRLNAEETQHLLRACGHSALYVKKRRDSIIMYALMHNMTLLQCNELLYEEKEDLLS